MAALNGADAAAIFRRAAITCLLNAKAYLFMFAIFPQFVRPEQGSVVLRVLALGIITLLTQVVVYGTLAFAAGSAQGWLAARPGAAVWIARAAGAILIAGALATAWAALMRG